jgi:hypothetical protein
LTVKLWISGLAFSGSPDEPAPELVSAPVVVLAALVVASGAVSVVVGSTGADVSGKLAAVVVFVTVASSVRL